MSAYYWKNYDNTIILEQKIRLSKYMNKQRDHILHEWLALYYHWNKSSDGCRGPGDSMS